MLVLRAMGLDAGLDLEALKAGNRSSKFNEARTLRDERLNSALLRIAEGQSVSADTSNCEAALIATMLRDKLHSRSKRRGD